MKGGRIRAPNILPAGHMEVTMPRTGIRLLHSWWHMAAYALPPPCPCIVIGPAD